MKKNRYSYLIEDKSGKQYGSGQDSFPNIYAKNESHAKQFITGAFPTYKLKSLKKIK